MIVDIIGRREMGKSTLAESIARSYPQELVFDIRNHFPAGPDGLLVSEDDDLAGALLDGERRIIVRPTGDLEEASALVARDVMQVLAERPMISLAIVIDEAGIVDLEPWDRIFRTSPRQTVWLILTCHRPVDVAPKIRAIADWFCCFRMTQDRDLQTMADRCGPEFAARLPLLKDREFLRWDDTTTDERRQITFYGEPDKWYVPLERPTVATGAPDPGLPEPTPEPEPDRKSTWGLF